MDTRGIKKSFQIIPGYSNSLVDTHDRFKEGNALTTDKAGNPTDIKVSNQMKNYKQIT